MMRYCHPACLTQTPSNKDVSRDLSPRKTKKCSLMTQMVRNLTDSRDKLKSSSNKALLLNSHLRRKLNLPRQPESGGVAVDQSQNHALSLRIRNQNPDPEARTRGQGDFRWVHLLPLWVSKAHRFQPEIRHLTQRSLTMTLRCLCKPKHAYDLLLFLSKKVRWSPKYYKH